MVVDAGQMYYCSHTCKGSGKPRQKFYILYSTIAKGLASWSGIIIVKLQSIHTCTYSTPLLNANTCACIIQAPTYRYNVNVYTCNNVVQ